MTPNAIIWEQPMDPQDEVEYKIDCTTILEPGENVSSYSLFVPAESQLFGLQLGSGARDSTISNNVVTLWISFSGVPVETPITLPIEITVVTTSVPSRTRQRTVAVKVDQL